MTSQCAAWLWANKLVALVLERFVVAEAGTVGIVRMAVVVVAAEDMVAGRMAEAAGVAVAAVGMVRKVS
jgi:hypothetical protein